MSTIPAKPGIIVSDHAVLRYIERQMAVDIEAIRAQIAATVASGVKARAPYVTHGGLRFVLRGHCVVTTLDKDWVWHLDNIAQRQAHELAAIEGVPL